MCPHVTCLALCPLQCKGHICGWLPSTPILRTYAENSHALHSTGAAHEGPSAGWRPSSPHFLLPSVNTRSLKRTLDHTATQRTEMESKAKSQEWVRKSSTVNASSHIASGFTTCLSPKTQLKSLGDPLLGISTIICWILRNIYWITQILDPDNSVGWVLSKSREIRAQCQDRSSDADQLEARTIIEIQHPDLERSAKRKKCQLSTFFPGVLHYQSQDKDPHCFSHDCFPQDHLAPETPKLITSQCWGGARKNPKPEMGWLSSFWLKAEGYFRENSKCAPLFTNFD